jgi:flagellar biosynthesis protein FlhB
LPDNSNLKFSTKSIRRAFYTLSPVLGMSAVDGILSDFGTQGLSMYDDKVEYDLSQIENAFTKIFGVATPLFFKQVKKELLKERA